MRVSFSPPERVTFGGVDDFRWIRLAGFVELESKLETKGALPSVAESDDVAAFVGGKRLQKLDLIVGASLIDRISGTRLYTNDLFVELVFYTTSGQRQCPNISRI